MLFGSIPDKFRCVATAKMTGERCRLPALQGTTACAKHGGYLHARRIAQKALGKKPAISLAAARYGRRALAALGAKADKSISDSIIERGRIVERERNRTDD